MAVKIVKRTYNEIYTDGETDWLLGNVGEWQTLKLELEAAIEMFPTTTKPIEINRQRNAFILTSGENWGDFGFDPGMWMVVKYRHETDVDGTTFSGNTTNNIFITNISGSVMEVANNLSLGLGNASFRGVDSLPTTFGDTRVFDVQFYVDQPPEGCRVKYVHLTNENYDTKNLASFIDGTLAEFVRPDLRASTGNFVPMEPVGEQSGMSIRKMEVKNLGKKSGTNNVYKFEIVIQFMISSFFEDITNFENLEIPSWLAGDGSLTDNFKIEFYPEWNNPNTMIQNELDWTLRKGNTGWFNENFNELNNDFEIESVQYFDENGNIVDSVDYAAATKVKAVIVGVPKLNAQTECGFGFAWIPLEETDYKNKKTAFYQNLFIQSGSLEDGFKLDTLYPDTNFGAGVDGAAMDSNNVKFTKLGEKIIFEANLIPNAEFFSKFDQKPENDRNFILWISVADGSLERNFSDRVALLADFGLLTKNIPPAGEYPYIDNAFIEHPFSETIIGEKVLNGIVQDDFLCRLPFRVPKDGSIDIAQISFGVEAFNVGTGASFDLEKFDFDVSQFPISNNIPQYDVDTTRGFKLNDGNNKNWVKIKREPGLDTSDFNGYIAYFATKIRWEDWLINQNTPDAFFDADEPNKGFNNDWFHYLSTLGWSVNFFSEMNVTEDGELKQYKNQWKMNFVDYDSNVNVGVEHKYFRDSDNTLLNVGTDPETGRPLGVILSNEPTRVEISFDILDTGTWTLLNTYGVMTIEIDKGPGRLQQRQLSSVWDRESDNPLSPVDGETKLKLAVDGTNKILTMTALVDPELLEDGSRYRITGRVGCLDAGNDVFDPGLYEFRYESTYE